MDDNLSRNLAAVSLSGFQYAPIQPGWIRILDLLSKPNEPLRCRLRNVELQDAEAAVDYLALSYVWGDSSKPCTMQIVDAISGEVTSSTAIETIALTTSLCDAIQSLRDCEQIHPKTFWIDQICIDQDNDEEKSHQVAQMGKVFQHAIQVVTYWGPQDEWDGDALDLMTRIYEHFKPLTETTEIAGLNEEILSSPHMEGQYRRMASEDLPPGLLFPEPIFKGEGFRTFLQLNRIISGPWSKRLWLFQENIVNTNTLFLRGQRTLSWDTLKLVCLLGWVGLIPWIDAGEEVIRLLRRRTTWHHSNTRASNGGRLRLHGLLRVAVPLDCFEPKDKVYAVLGLATDAEELGIVPDYTKSTAQTFTDVSVAFIKRNLGRSPAYSLFELERSSREKSSDITLPSWVPAHLDWGYGVHKYANINASQTKENGTPRNAQVSISFESTASVKNGILVVQGMDLGLVLDRSLGTFPGQWLLGGLGINEVDEVLKILEGAQSCLGESDHSLAFLYETLVMGQSLPTDSTQETAEAVAARAVRDILDLLRRAKSGDRICMKESSSRFYLPVASLPGGLDSLAHLLLKDSDIFPYRSLWVTSDQRLCLTPHRVQKGDIAVILFGGEWIYYLRPIGDMFEYIGWGYIAGFMHGKPFEVDDWEDAIKMFRLR